MVVLMYLVLVLEEEVVRIILLVLKSTDNFMPIKQMLKTHELASIYRCRLLRAHR